MATELVTMESKEPVSEISPRDDMYRGDRDHYFRAGGEAVDGIAVAMQAGDKLEVRRILDCPSGHGRVLRHLRAAFPGASITACDIDKDAVDFCAKTFGAKSVYAHASPDDIQFDEEFDLIWCGSLFTHLDEVRFRGFLNLFEAALAPGGLLVFTTNGPHTFRMLRALTSDDDVEAKRLVLGGTEQIRKYFPVPDEALPRLFEGYERDGFAYADYDFMDNFGATLSSASWTCSQLERFERLRLVLYTEQGWDAVQDIVACQRRVDAVT